MAFVLTPRFAPAYQQCSPFGGCAPRPAQTQRQRVSRPDFSFAPFLGQFDEILSELEREARRAEHKQRQQRKRAFRARFDVRENKDGYEVEGEVPGFEQENISIEVTDEYTLKIAGDTERKSEQAEDISATEAQTTEAEAATEKMDGVTLNESEATTQDVSDTHSETGSRKSYNATVEDDFEDLGADASSTISNTSTSHPTEPKGKEKAVEPTDTTIQPQRPQPQVPTEPETREWLSERIHGSFERTFQFPERIDAENVKASLKNGVLSIKMPKAAAPKVRQITFQ